VVQEPDQVVERVPISRILANEPITERRLAAAGSGYGLAPKVPTGMRAMSVRVNDVIGVAGFVLPEARVDVLVTGTPLGMEARGEMTRTLLSNVRVISAGENIEPDSSGRAQRVTVVTLLVTPEQAELLTLAGSHGKLQLVLRNSRDEEVITSRGVREPQVFLAEVQPLRRAGQARPVAPPRAMPPPPPPPAPAAVQVEVFRGNQRSVQSFTPAGGGGATR
jgi:pilus assembly protein CpaB